MGRVHSGRPRTGAGEPAQSAEKEAAERAARERAAAAEREAAERAARERAAAAEHESAERMTDGLDQFFKPIAAGGPKPAARRVAASPQTGETRDTPAPIEAEEDAAAPPMGAEEDTAAAPIEAEEPFTASWSEDVESGESVSQEDPAGASVEDLLGGSPIFSTPARAATRGRAAEASIRRSPAAIAIATLASEVGEMGVPEGQRARVRAALLDIARVLDAREMRWEDLRVAVGAAMEFPAIGRKVLPVIVPFLDRAA
ncbi:MAG: hypothetical protein A2W00_09430 [Candidatus Eisenbacteria bacterium RBG_16_71_46]|nr:MAG: hypothetical protein A2W00_09430 [Candidatus Eisenbacteria bacterium RBG_16_71_46]